MGRPEETLGQPSYASSLHVFFVTAAFVFEAVGLGCLFLAFRFATEANGPPPVWKVGLRRLTAKIGRPKTRTGTIGTTVGDGLSLEGKGYLTLIKGPKDDSVDARFEETMLDQLIEMSAAVRTLRVGSGV